MRLFDCHDPCGEEPVRAMVEDHRAARSQINLDGLALAEPHPDVFGCGQYLPHPLNRCRDDDVAFDPVRLHVASRCGLRMSCGVVQVKTCTIAGNAQAATCTFGFWGFSTGGGEVARYVGR